MALDTSTRTGAGTGPATLGGARGTPERIALLGSRAALAALTVGFAAAALVGAVPSLRTQLVVYLFGMVALNLPHGGYEHYVNLRRRGLPFGARYVAIYLAFVAAFVGLFLLAPVPALVLAFATAVAKGGGGDLGVLDALVGADHVRGRPRRLLAGFVRGGAVMILPLVFHPGTFYAFSAYMVNVFEPGALAAVAGRTGVVPAVLGGVYGLAVLAHLGLGFAAAGPTRGWLVDAGETLLLIAYFAVVPPVVSIGLYFPLWYSLRQAGRSAAVERATPTTDGGLPVTATWAAMVAGAAVTVGLLAGLYVVAPNPLGGAGPLAGAVALYTVFVCVIALPHVVVGGLLDAERGIWYVP